MQKLKITKKIKIKIKKTKNDKSIHSNVICVDQRISTKLILQD